MGKINWVSLFLEKNIDLKSEDKDKLLKKQAVMDLSIKEVRRIATLGDSKKETAILCVYGSRKFDGEAEDSFTAEDKERIINTLFDANGDKQFVYACSVIFNTRSPRNRDVLESVSLVAGATHDFQAELSSYIALDKHMQRHESFIRIVRILTLLDKDKAVSFYEYIKMSEDSDIDTFELSKIVSEKLKEYESLMGIKPTTVYSPDGDPRGGTPGGITKSIGKK